LPVPRAVQGKKHFVDVIFGESADLDQQRVEQEVVEAALELQEQHPGLGALLLECSDLPPDGHAVQRATGLPVFDWIGFTDCVHHAVVRRPYAGLF